MRVFLLAMGLFLAASAVHLVVWRVRVPRRQTRAILVVYVCTLIVGGALCRGAAPSCVDLCRTALLFMTLTAAYVITYSAIEAESPSLVIALHIAQGCRDGIRKDALARAMSDQLLILPRIEDLVRDKMVYVTDARFRLTAKGRWFVRIFIGWRALLGLPRGG